MVKMLKPYSLFGKAEVAQLQEQALKLQGKTVKTGGKVMAERKNGLYRSLVSASEGGNYYKLPETHNNTTSTSKQPKAKRISP